jgi:hypothetical protein
MSDVVLCKDCKHSFRKVSDWLAHGSASFAYSCRKSFKPAHDEPDLVLGSKKVPAKYESCGVARIGRPDRTDRCGESGKFWEPKNKRDLFKYIKHVSV